MDEAPIQDDEAGWQNLQPHACPHCGSHRVVPAGAVEWAGDSYCLDCRELVRGTRSA